MLLAVKGWGQLANLGVLMVGLLAFNSMQFIHSSLLCASGSASLGTCAVCCTGVGSAGQPGGADGGSAGLQQQGQWALQPWGSWRNLQILLWLHCCIDSLDGVLPYLAYEACNWLQDEACWAG